MDIVFDTFYEAYDDWYNTKTGAFVDRIETAAAFKLLEPKAGMKVLDAGCGTGNFSFKLAELGCLVTGVDISKNMLAGARQKAAQKKWTVCFLEMDGGRLDFDDGSFDAALSMAVFEFVRRPPDVYGELKRVVKPGGTIVIGTIQKGGAWEKLYSSGACAGTAYAQAVFMTGDDLSALDPEGACAAEQCLFTPPGLDETRYTLQSEAEYKAQNNTGGFVCVKFKKNR
jgi:ubiquinone/menaquinone biosynthesis C-methylase UbiE